MVVEKLITRAKNAYGREDDRRRRARPPDGRPLHQGPRRDQGALLGDRREGRVAPGGLHAHREARASGRATAPKWPLIELVDFQGVTKPDKAEKEAKAEKSGADAKEAKAKKTAKKAAGKKEKAASKEKEAAAHSS